MVLNGYVPKIFNKVNPLVNKPIYAICLNFLIAMIMFTPFREWKTMTAFLTSLISLTYLTGATSTVAMRNKLSDIDRPLRLKFVNLVLVVGIFVSSMIFFMG